jgi:transposase-like protein
MDAVAFATWLLGVRCLDASQRGRAFQELALAGEPDPGSSHKRIAVAAMAVVEAEAVPLVVRAGTVNAASGPDLLSQIGQDRLASFGCPHCGGDDIRPWGKASGKPRYRCVSCRKTFNPLTGTPLAGLHYPDRWQDQARALISGETIAKAATRCGVDYTTAFRWRHRFLEALNRDKPVRLFGIVEADETFVLESFKGKRRGLPRAARKRGGKAGKRGLSAEQIPVLVARDRTGATIDAVLPRLDAASITTVLGQVISRPPCPDDVPCSARAGQSVAGRTGSAHQQRERLPRPPQGMDAAVPWRRHRKPSELPELAENDRSPRSRVEPAGVAYGSSRTGAISTGFAIRAKIFMSQVKTIS